jgi:hypothetical protein
MGNIIFKKGSEASMKTGDYQHTSRAAEIIGQTY